MDELDFEWDTDKEVANVLKHGVSFETAQRAFVDHGVSSFRTEFTAAMKNATIAWEKWGEESCRFASPTGAGACASSERVIGGKVESCMKKRIKYTDEPMEVGEPIKDFLPPPEKMRFRRSAVRVTYNPKTDIL